MSSRKKAENMSFEESMTELEQLVQSMEHGELPLEQALAGFERGITLARESQDKLKKAEQRIQVLMEKDGQTTLTELDSNIDHE